MNSIAVRDVDWLPVSRVLAEVRGLIALAIPIVACIVGGALIGAIDAVMLGPLGDATLAAVALTQTVYVLCYASLYGLVSSVGLLVGKAYGAGRIDQSASILRHGIVIGTVGALIAASMMIALLPARHLSGAPSDVLAILPIYWGTMAIVLVPVSFSMVLKQFLSAIGRPWISVGLTLLPMLTKIPLNWLLIYGNLGFPKLGLEGAGLATMGAMLCVVVAMIVYLRNSGDVVMLRVESPLRRGGYRELMREGRPMSLQYLAEGGAVATARMLTGLFGASVLAATDIVFSVGNLIYMAPIGMASAVSIRIAQACGRAEQHRIRAIGLAGLSAVTCWTCAVTITMLLWGDNISGAFVSDKSTIAAASVLFLIVGLMQIFDGLQSVSLGALRGMLDTHWPTRVSLFSYWLIALPLGVLLGFAFNLESAGLWLGFGTGIASASVILVWRFLHMTAVICTPDPVSARPTSMYA